MGRQAGRLVDNILSYGDFKNLISGVVMGDIDIFQYDYCHEQISRLLSTQFLS